MRDVPADNWTLEHTTGQDIDQYTVQLSCPALFKLYDSGKIKSATIKYRIRHRVSPAGSWTYNPTVSGSGVDHPDSWYKIKGDIFTVPLSENFKQDSLEEFIKDYKKNKNNKIFTLQFHHANLSDKQFELMKDVIDFLKNKEKRIFVKPSELLKLVDK